MVLWDSLASAQTGGQLNATKLCCCSISGRFEGLFFHCRKRLAHLERGSGSEPSAIFLRSKFGLTGLTGDTPILLQNVWLDSPISISCSPGVWKVRDDLSDPIQGVHVG